MESKKERLPKIFALYQNYLLRQDLERFVVEASSCYTPGTLQRLASHHAVSVRRAVVMVLTAVGDFRANATLARAMHDEDKLVAMLAETGIKILWRRDFSAEDQATLHEITHLVNIGDANQAVLQATQQLSLTPDFAEVWNQRGNAWFSLGNYTQAVEDFRQALALNPYHFAAAAMQGFAYIHLRKKNNAQIAFRKGLLINPALKYVQRQLSRLSKTR